VFALRKENRPASERERGGLNRENPLVGGKKKKEARHSLEKCSVTSFIGKHRPSRKRKGGNKSAQEEGSGVKRGERRRRSVLD